MSVNRTRTGHTSSPIASPTPVVAKTLEILIFLSNEFRQEETRPVVWLNAPDDYVVDLHNPETNAVEGNSTIGTQLSTSY